MRCENVEYSSWRDLVSRRDLLSRMGTGVAGIALASLLGEDEGRAAERSGAAALGAPPSPRTHFPPRATSVIQLFQHGGPSHMDLLDPKPELTKRDGQPMPKYFTDRVLLTAHGGLLGAPFKFFPAGQSGVEFSELLPHAAKCADDIAVVRSMFAEHNNHEQALWQMHTGRTVTGRPALGCWVDYALGSENRDLPAYVVLRNDSGLPVDGPRNWSSGWLPPKYQGVHLRNSGPPVLYLNSASSAGAGGEEPRAALLRRLNEEHLARNPAMQERLEARIAAYELAGRMQLTAADALDINQETAATHQAYGLDNPVTAPYARRCLMARRLVERGVRFVQVFVEGQRWDTHSNNAEATKRICLETDQPTGALVADLKARGLLDSTLVLWGGEFGRTPVSQGGNGRDHHKQGFSLWMAGGGVKGGQAYGATDELGYHAVEKRVQVADFHATILHLLGLDHARVSYHLHGRDERLTDVYDAHVLRELIA